MAAKPFRKFRPLSKRATLPTLPVTLPATFQAPDGRPLPDLDHLSPPIGLPPAVFRKGQPLDDLVLSLALACNDINNCMWVARQTALGKRTEQETDGYDGAVSGMELWAARLSAGVLNEILEAVDKHHNLLDTHPDAVKAYGGLPTRQRSSWEWVKRLASDGKSEDRRYLLQVRNNLAYHYHQPKRLAEGYAAAFDENNASPFTQHAWVSFGDRLSAMRFYFVDAAVQYAHRKAHQTTEEGDDFTRLRALGNRIADGTFVMVLGFIDQRLVELGLKR